MTKSMKNYPVCKELNFIYFQKVSYTPEKVSPEKTSDWFCNSFDSRAARNKSNVTVLSKTSHAKSKSKQMEKKVDQIQHIHGFSSLLIRGLIWTHSRWKIMYSQDFPSVVLRFSTTSTFLLLGF